MTTSVNTLPVVDPPPRMGLIPITDPAWTRWLTQTVWGIIGAGSDASGPQGAFPKLQVSEATFDDSYMGQDLLRVDKGLYSLYYSGNGGIIYGFACNVHRASGTNFVVAAQLNAWAESGVTCPVFGLAPTVLCLPGSSNCTLVGIETDIVNMDDANTAVKIGIQSVFKNRFDGVGTVVNGVGSNLYNWNAIAYSVDSAPRSAAGEFCGWTVGLQFLDGWCDTDNPQAWSASFNYQRGQTVTQGGLVYASILGGNLNHSPAASPTWWVTRTYAGTVDSSIGIDFSTLSVTTMGIMSSAIRLRNGMYVHWEESGAVGSLMNGASGYWELQNQTNFRFGVNMTDGVVKVGNAKAPNGAVTAATIGKIGGAGGPTIAAQSGWIKIRDSSGTDYWMPVWQ